MHAHIHTRTLQKLICSASGEAKQSGVVAGGRVRAAVCEIEALMSPKDSAKAWGEMAK